MFEHLVVNKHHKQPFDVYIGRGSKWGNPFSHLDNTSAQFKVESREEAVIKYREWIKTQPHLLNSLHELEGKILCCYCKPKSCHGDVLAEMANAKNNKTIHIAFTGHRPKNLGGYNIETKEYKKLQQDLELYIEKNLEVYNVVVGHSGLALGGDTIWSKAILNMKSKYQGRVLFHAEIPMLEQPEAWFNKKDIDFWKEQVENADFKTIYGSLEECNRITNKEEREKARNKLAGKHLDNGNKGMLSHADVVLALYDGSRGGTSNAINDAKKMNLPTHIVHPNVYFK